MRRFAAPRKENYLNPCWLFGLLSGAGIAGMTIADYEGLGRLRSLSGSPFGMVEGTMTYMVFAALTASIWLGAIVLRDKRERRSLAQTLRSSKFPALLTGVGLF